MQTAETLIRDVGEADFAAQVIERSRTTPVVVDFWAPWCGPCRVLGPTLERLTQEAGGAFELVKVNVDEAPALSMQYGIQGIPAVKAFKDGRVVSQFTGAQPEGVVRDFLARLAPSEADRLTAQAARHEQAGDTAAAAAAYRQALAATPEHPEAVVGLARVLLASGDGDAALPLLEGVVDHAVWGPEARRLQARVSFAAEARAAGGEDAARARAAERPNDPQALYQLAVTLIQGEDYREAFDILLDLVRRHRRWGNDAARRAMLQVFDLVDDESLVREYRGKLAQTLF